MACILVNARRLTSRRHAKAVNYKRLPPYGIDMLPALSSKACLKRYLKTAVCPPLFRLFVGFGDAVFGSLFLNLLADVAGNGLVAVERHLEAAAPLGQGAQG